MIRLTRGPETDLGATGYKSKENTTKTKRLQDKTKDFENRTNSNRTKVKCHQAKANGKMYEPKSEQHPRASKQARNKNLEYERQQGSDVSPQQKAKT